jgi:hypothetical protein
LSPRPGAARTHCRSSSRSAGRPATVRRASTLALAGGLPPLMGVPSSCGLQGCESYGSLRGPCLASPRCSWSAVCGSASHMRRRTAGRRALGSGCRRSLVWWRSAPGRRQSVGCCFGSVARVRPEPLPHASALVGFGSIGGKTEPNPGMIRADPARPTTTNPRPLPGSTTALGHRVRCESNPVARRPHFRASGAIAAAAVWGLCRGGGHATTCGRSLAPTRHRKSLRPVWSGRGTAEPSLHDAAAGGWGGE